MRELDFDPVSADRDGRIFEPAAETMPLDQTDRCEHDLYLDSLRRKGWTGFAKPPPPSQKIRMEQPASAEPESQIVYWHRELPPVDAQFLGEHTLEATSMRVPGTLAHRDELWEQCYEDLMVQARQRLEQEVSRLEGHYAHVLDETVDSRHDPVKDEAWLHGAFVYSLYRRVERGEKGGKG